MIRTFTIAFTLMAATATPVFAQFDRVQTRKVSYQDLDLSRAADRDVLQRRLKVAATKVCEPGLPYTSVTILETLACRRAALGAVEPQLARLYVSHELRAEGSIAVAASRSR